MRKQMTMIAVLCAAVCLGGCGAEVGTADAPAAETTVSGTDITVAEQTTAITAESIVSADPAAGTQSQTAQAADQAAATAAAAGAETTAATPAANDNSAVEAAYISKIVGRWVYQELDQSANAGSEVYNSIGYLTVNADGTFNYEPFDGSGKKNGKITIGYDSYADGTVLSLYDFIESNGNTWSSCYCEQESPDTYWIGNGGISRFVRDTGNAAAGNHAADEADISQIVGTWSYEESSSPDYTVFTQLATVTVKADGTYTYQPKDGSAAKTGTVKAGYEEWGDGTREATFSFYENGTTFWNGGYVSHISNGTFMLGNGDTARLVRIS